MLKKWNINQTWIVFIWEHVVWNKVGIDHLIDSLQSLIWFGYSFPFFRGRPIIIDRHFQFFGRSIECCSANIWKRKYKIWIIFSHSFHHFVPNPLHMWSYQRTRVKILSENLYFLWTCWILKVTYTFLVVHFYRSLLPKNLAHLFHLSVVGLWNN